MKFYEKTIPIHQKSNQGNCEKKASPVRTFFLDNYYFKTSVIAY